ncbi:MAG: hypothetical protein KF884_04000 [Fimbriimonadaceae bacterium]|nr:hypothetical protein [Fimbriimonadaceae bacterium]QYK59252.1 MAG: hypothetical protein KF884_04000 [Fimbriimonadaceae bacterium]
MESFKRLLWIVAIAMGCGVVMYVVSGFFPKRYQSYQTLYFPMLQTAGSLSSVLGGGGDVSVPSSLGGAFAVPLVATGAQAATGIIQSRAAHRDVVRKLDLEKRWNMSEADAISAVRESVSIRLDKSNLVRVEVTARSPEEAVAINKQLFAHLLKRSDELTINVSSRIRQSIETAIVGNEKRLIEKRTRLQRILLETPVGKVEDETRAFITAREKYDEAKIESESAREKLAAAERESRIVLSQPDGAQALEGMASPLANARPVGEAGYRNLAQELQKRRLALLDAAAKFQPDTPEYRAAKRDSDNAEKLAREAVNAEKQALDRSASPGLAAAKVELSALLKVVSATGKLLEQYRSQVQSAPLVNEALADYQALIDVKSMLTRELEKAKLNESSDPSRFQQVDVPEADSRPVSPRPGINALLVFAAVLVILAVPEMARAFRAAATASPDQRPS